MATETSPLLHTTSSSPSASPAASPAASDPDEHPTTASQGGNRQDEPASLSAVRACLLGSAMFVLIFLCAVNMSALTTTQSSIAADLHATTEVSWFNSSYLIAITSIAPLIGKFCQIFSARWYILASAVFSAIGLLLDATAPSIPVFVLGRVIYGLGAAMGPIALILIVQYADERSRGFYFALVNCAYTTGVATGAVIAGAMDSVFGWRSVFWVQVGITLVAALVAFFSIPGSRDTGSGSGPGVTIRHRLSRLDYFGTITLIGSIVLLLFALSAPQVEALPIGLSISALLVFVLVEHYWALDPIIPPVVLKSKGAILTGVATVGVMSARWSVLFYTPTYGIAVRLWSQSQAGSLLIPTNAGFGLGGILVGLLHIRRAGSYYVPTLTSFAVFAILHFLLGSLLTASSSVWLLAVTLCLHGAATGALLNYSLAHLLHLTASQNHVIVLPLNMMFRTMAGAFGSSISGGIFLRSLQTALRTGFFEAGLEDDEALIAELLGRPQLVQKLDGVVQDVAVTSYSASLRNLFIAGSFLVIIMLVVQASTGWRSPEHKNSDPDAEDMPSD